MFWKIIAFDKLNKKIEYVFQDIDEHAATMNAYRLCGTMGLNFGWIIRN